MKHHKCGAASYLRYPCKNPEIAMSTSSPQFFPSIERYRRGRDSFFRNCIPASMIYVVFKELVICITLKSSVTSSSYLERDKAKEKGDMAGSWGNGNLHIIASDPPSNHPYFLKMLLLFWTPQVGPAC